MKSVFFIAILVLATSYTGHAQQDPGILYLVDSDTDQNLFALEDGATYNLNQLNLTNISLNAVPDPSITVNRVFFDYGPISNPNEVDDYSEGLAPYAISGDSNGDFRPWAYVEANLDVQLSILVGYRRASDNVRLEQLYRVTFTRTATSPQDTTPPSINQFTATTQGEDAIPLCEVCDFVPQ